MSKLSGKCGPRGLGQECLGALGVTVHVLLPPYLWPGPGCLVKGVFYGWNLTHGQFVPGPQSYLPVEEVNNSGKEPCCRQCSGLPHQPRWPMN